MVYYFIFTSNIEHPYKEQYLKFDSKNPIKRILTSLKSKYFLILVNAGNPVVSFRQNYLNVHQILTHFQQFRSSRPEVFLRKGALKTCSKFIEIVLRHGCSPVNLLHIFRTPFPRNTSGWLLLMVVTKSLSVLVSYPLTLTILAHKFISLFTEMNSFSYGDAQAISKQ